MALLDKLSKSVSKAADQAKFEAEKLRKVTAKNSEVSKLKDELRSAKVAIGEKVLELKQSGQAVPGLEELVGQAEALQSQAEQAERELEALKAMDYEEKAAEAPAEQPAEQPAGKAKFCPNCGAALAEGAKFCPECGAKVG